MRLQHRISKSVRVPARLKPLLNREIVRLSLNPILYQRSQRLVRWTRDSKGNISPHDVVARAVRTYPELPLSTAVEGILIEMLDSGDRNHDRLSIDEYNMLQRFSRLPVSEKIRLTRNRSRLFRYLKNLPWKKNEKRKRI